MRICVISSSVFACPTPGYAGLEMVAYHCAKGLAAKGHQVTLIAPMGSTCPGVEVYQCLPAGAGEEQAYGGCVIKDANGQDHQWGGFWPKLLEFNGPDGVIIDHSWQKHSALLKMEGRLTCPILATMHAPVNTMYGSIPPEGVLSFVCISDDQKQHFEALHSPRKAMRAYNGIDLDFYKPLDTPRSNRYLFLARFSTIKGASLSLEACINTDTELDLVGDRQITGEPQYYEHCCRLADGKKRKIIGGIPRGETVWWYSQAYAFLHLNKYFREPFGLAPIEAMACGLPVIAWKYGAMTETIKHGETGFLVESMQEVEHLIRTNAANTISRERCREWAFQFSIENMVSQYEDLCFKTLNKGAW